jgi:peptidoglycan hydrolase CwlO-like protein
MPDEYNYIKARQDAMAEDISEMKDSLKGINEALHTLARLEERHSSTQDNVFRLNSRIDDHEERIRSNETKLASQMWIERVMWVAVAAFVSFGVGMLK